MSNPIQGIHHITAIASDPQRNLDFYSQVLGQRFVKKTINFDDPGTYHMYYGDQVGSPGTIMTHFPWPGARPGRRGTGEVAASAYKILPSSLDYWRARLTELDVDFIDEDRFGETVLVFTDPDNQAIELVATESDPAPTYWDNGPIPEEHALRGFHSVSLNIRHLEATTNILVDIFGYSFVKNENNRYRYQGGGQTAEFIDLIVNPDLGRGQSGAGTVHHVAFRTDNDAEQLEWQRKIAERGIPITEVKDRQYFHSIYFREPNGVLFEIATDTPGFPVDEPVEELGKNLKLPPWHEVNRDRIEQILLPLKIAEYETA